MSGDGVNGTVVLVESVPESFADLVTRGLATAGAAYSLFLSGGGTATECYRALAGRPGLPWDRVDLFLGDERCVPPDDPDSNHRMITEVLIDAVGPVHADHPMYVGGEPAAAAARPRSSRVPRRWPTPVPATWWRPTPTRTPSTRTSGSR